MAEGRGCRASKMSDQGGGPLQDGLVRGGPSRVADSRKPSRRQIQMSWSQEGQSNGAELLELFRGGPIREGLPNGVLYMSKQAGKRARTQGSWHAQRQASDQSTNQSSNQSIDQSINQSISQSINQSINQSVTHSINQTFNHSLTQSINQSLTQSINHSINRSINK